jgi:hypothetical protein
LRVERVSPQQVKWSAAATRARCACKRLKSATAWRVRVAHVDAVCFQMAPRVLRHDHAPEIASSDHKDVGSGGEDRREIPDCEAVTVPSPPGVDAAFGSEDDVGGVGPPVDLDLAETVASNAHRGAPRISVWSPLSCGHVLCRAFGTRYRSLGTLEVSLLRIPAWARGLRGDPILGLVRRGQRSQPIETRRGCSLGYFLR